MSTFLSFLFVCGVVVISAANIPKKPMVLDDIQDDNYYLRQQIGEAQTELADLKKSIMNALSPQPSLTCTTHNTPVQHHPSGETYDHLNAHDVRCPDGRVMTRFHLNPVYIGDKGESNLHFEYTCCTLI